MRTPRRPTVTSAARSSTPLWVGLLASLAAVGLAAETTELSSFSRCRALVRDSPSGGAAYRCYLEVARSDGSFPEAAGRLEQLLDSDPDNPHLLRWLAQLEADQGRDRARQLYVAAAEAFAGSGETAEEVETRTALAQFLLRRGARDEARRQLDLAAAAAARTESAIARG